MNQNQQIQSDSGECPVCHGTGWELYTATVVDYGLPEEITFAQRCSKCRGQFRGEDRTGTPKEYHDADLTIPIIGRCERDKDGNGIFYAGDDLISCLGNDLYVNAWMELPERYREDES